MKEQILSEGMSKRNQETNQERKDLRGKIGKNH